MYSLPNLLKTPKIVICMIDPMKKCGPVHAHNDLLLAMIGAQRAFILKRICAIWCMHLAFVHVNRFSGNVSTMRCIGNEGANCGLISTIQKLSILRWCWTSKWRGGQKNDIAHGVLDSREFSSQRVLCAKTPRLQISTARSLSHTSQCCNSILSGVCKC